MLDRAFLCLVIVDKLFNIEIILKIAVILCLLYRFILFYNRF